MPKISTPKLVEIHTWDEVPEFATEREEAEFWDTHSLADELWDDDNCADLPPPGTRYGVSIGFDADVAERVRALARRKGRDYVTLLKEFVAERLYEEEKREGIIRAAK